MNKQRTFFPKTPGAYPQPILIDAIQRSKYNSYAPGLVDLMQEAICGKLPQLTIKWTERLLRNPLANEATVDEWREHFLRMVEEYRREQNTAA